MKIRFAVTLEVDPKDWAREYCMDPQDTVGIRNDVQAYCETQIGESAAGQASLLRVRS